MLCWLLASSVRVFEVKQNEVLNHYNTAGTQDNVVILLFGKSGYSNGTYGAYDWTGRGSSTTVFISDAQIAAAVEQFGWDYYKCALADSTSQVYVAAGLCLLSIEAKTFEQAEYIPPLFIG